ncbi:MAG: hypothetical protein JRN45_00790 [Nitrososphaerota archaeon]|nr:hypothetical protein [Nitrososphaerota archaeon]
MVAAVTRRCRFCGGTYWVEKIADHEALCSARPRKLSLKEAVEAVLRSEPAAATNSALLVRRVWELKDGYRTPEPGRDLADPWSIVRQRYAVRKGERR